MDNRFGEMMTFMAVARGGTFAAAAKALRVTPSAVSRTVARLEERLGVQLVCRTTRALALTPEGEAYHERIAGLMAEIDDVERGFGHDAGEPRGLLRVNASVGFGTQCLLPLVARFMEAHPGVKLELTLSDALAEMIEERTDIAIRIGPLSDNRLRAKKLGRSRLSLVVSPDYLARHGTPRHPDDLDHHTCLRFSFRRSVEGWPFLLDGRLVHRNVEGRFLGSSGEVVRLAALAGAGIARLARFHVAEDVAAGRLVEVLADYDPAQEEDIHALYVGHERLALRVRSFLDFLDRDLKIRD
ncbi:LysR family transcriptional regulator [Sphingomonas sp.]|uniref:LysR family transcriptional regulator n=1 Tax=Sphingomonas sp. TaxID=28214 RepID=UPI000DB60066|nr:LysR family transcriptional regulator [Sphingomonas sp.]PZU10207.1 MAG: LysR family transcriptional regulator [Sphingomonas sp.]